MLGDNVVKQGGWIKYLENEQLKVEFDNKKQIAELKNIETSTKVNKFLLKTKWLPHGLVLVSFGFAVLMYLDARNDSKKLEQRIEKLEKAKTIQQLDHKKRTVNNRFMKCRMLNQLLPFA